MQIHTQTRTQSSGILTVFTVGVAVAEGTRTLVDLPVGMALPVVHARFTCTWVWTRLNVASIQIVLQYRQGALVDDNLKNAHQFKKQNKKQTATSSGQKKGFSESPCLNDPIFIKSFYCTAMICMLENKSKNNNNNNNNNNNKHTRVVNRRNTPIKITLPK